jgi:hypothetical protein
MPRHIHIGTAVRLAWTATVSRRFCGTWSWDTAQPEMEGVYAHVTPESRAALIAADEADWNSSLAAWGAISPTSPTAVLDALLTPFRDGQP